MASLLKLGIDSSQWDAGLKKAQQALNAFTQSQGGLQQAIAKDNGEMVEFVKMIGQMDSSSKNTKGQMRELTQAINDLTLQYRSLTDEEKSTPFGQALNASIQQLTERAGNVKDVMIDTENAIKHASSDTRTFDQLAQGASVATSAFQGLTGAGKLLGIEMGDDVAVIAKLQAAMAVTNSLTTIQTALQKESALMQGVLAMRTKAAAVAQKLLAATTGDATKAQAAFNAVAKANPLGILVTAITAVVGAFALMGNSAEEATEHIDETRRAVEKLTEAANYYIQVAQAMGASQQTIRDMQKDAARQAFEAAKQHADELEKARTMFMNLGQTPPEELTKQYEEAQKLKEETKNAYQEALRADRMQKEIQFKLTKNWQNASTEKEINATINAFKNLRSEVKVGSSAYDEYTRRIDILEKKLPKVTPAKTGGGGGRTTVGSTETPKEVTETQQLQQSIEALTKEYQTLSTAEKVSDMGMLFSIEARKAAIRDEIQTNQQRIDELKKFADEAQGKTVTVTVELETGISGTNEASVSSYVKKLQEELAGIDYSVAGSFQKAANLNSNIIDAQTFGNLLKTSIQQGIDIAAAGLDVESIFDKIASGEGIENADWEEFAAKINEQLKKQGIKLTIDPKTGGVSTGTTENKGEEKSVSQTAGQITGSINSIANGIESLGMEIPEGFKDMLNGMQALTTILSAISSIVTVIAAIQGTKAIPVVGWALSTGGMNKNGKVIHAAAGTTVPGNYGYDAVPAMLTSGEVVLNRAEVGNLASQLYDGGGQQQVLQPYVSGENILLGVNNHLRRSGQGEIVTTNMLRRMGVI